MMYDWTTAKGSEAVVDLDDRKLVFESILDSQEPPPFWLIFARIEEAVHADPRWTAAMKRRGIRDDEGIRMAPQVPFPPRLGAPAPPISVAAWVNNARSTEAENLYLTTEVDLVRGIVTRFEDHLPPQTPSGADLFARDGGRPALKPLRIEQPAGPGFAIQGTQLRWQNWEVRFGVNPRRGLELHDVAYRDGTGRRTILYRASVTEMVAPYGDPGWMSFYPPDEGGRGLARAGSLRSAERGEDTPPNAVFRAAVTHDSRGNPIEVPRAVTIYERDDGIVWRHHDESRRSRALVVTTFHTVDNYDYEFSWIFRQDGTIEAEAVLTGVINSYHTQRERESTAGVERQTISAVLVAPRIAGPIHQHFFSYRLDFDIDGVRNSVVEMNTATLSPIGNGSSHEWFATHATVLTRELDAKRNIDMAAGRWWKIVNTDLVTVLGQHPGYALMPGHNSMPYADADSAVRRMFGFLDAHLWVTAYAPDELYAAGRLVEVDYAGEGLPRWIQANREIENRDVVVWYTLGVTHLPRPEDWPIMPARRAGFMLMPFGFFDNNPAIDVSRPHPWK